MQQVSVTLDGIDYMISYKYVYKIPPNATDEDLYYIRMSRELFFDINDVCTLIGDDRLKDVFPYYISRNWIDEIIDFIGTERAKAGLNLLRNVD